MTIHLFADFLESRERYAACEAYWRRLLDEVAIEAGRANDWHPWQTRTYMDGSPEPEDGNPILDARSETLGRAVRVIQHPPQGDGLEIAAWLDDFDFSQDGGPGYTEELVINLALSDESAQEVRALMLQWMDRAISRERMEDVVETLKPRWRGMRTG
jgi:hypothetical protein